jgi:iron complex outermembrane receptor protein
MAHVLRGFAGACALAAFSGSAAAQERPADLTRLPLEELLQLEVVSASRFPQKVAQAPSAVTVITADDIRIFGYRTLAEALRSVRGLHVTYDRNYRYLGVLGFARTGDYNSRVLVLMDGVRLNDNIYDQGPIGNEFPVDLELVERIEFVPGPGSSVYGGNAIFGVINVITRRGAEYDGAVLGGGAGSHGRAEARASWGRRLENGADVLVSLSGFGSRGADLRYDEFVPRGVPDGTARGLDFERDRKAFARAAQGPWSLALAHSERTKGIPTGSFGTAPAVPGSQTLDETTLVSLGYEDKAGDHALLTAKWFAGRYRYVGHYVYDVPPRTINKDEALGAWWGAEARLVHTGWRAHKLVLGAELQRDWRKDQLNYDVDPYALYLEDLRRGARFGLYAQDEIALRANLLLNAGIRYDRLSGRSGAFNPRLALIHHPFERATLKAIHGTAYRPPNAYELFYAAPGPGGQKGNPGLRNERIRTTELVAEYLPTPALRVAVNLFRYTASELIEASTDPADGLQVFLNTGRARSSGAGLEIERRWPSGTRLRASYGYQRAADRNGLWLVNSPRHLAKLNAALPLAGGWFAGAELQYASRRRTLASSVPGHAIANSNLTYRPALRGLEFSLGIYNLLDRRYADPGGPEHLQDRIAQDGRTLLARLRYGF